MPDPSRWQHIESVCQRALEMDARDRDAWLETACKGDADLLAVVRSLLAQDRDAPGFLTPSALQNLVAQNVPQRSPDIVGRRLGPYEVAGFVGAGGMGAVYRARDTRLDRAVAVKLLSFHATTDPEQRRRFSAEARAAGALSHPNVLAVYDVGEDHGIPYIVSELLDGETLRAKLAAGPLTQRRATEYAIQIARGLAAAHDAHLVHRDLKPENVFVTADGRIKILDFGIAKQLIGADAARAGVAATATSTDSGIVIGTASYMAPEQVRGEPVDHRTDIFAFGAVLYEMLSGVRAFLRPSFAETMAAVVNDDVADLAEIGKRPVSPALQQIVRRCLEKEPRLRFQSATDLAYALELVASETPGRSDRHIGGTRRAVVRHWKTAVLVLAGIGAGALAMASASKRVPQEPIYTRATFGNGLVANARFLRGSTDILYETGGDGPVTLYRERFDGSPAQAVPIAFDAYFSVSDAGDLALRPPGSARLARQPLTGGAPHDLADAVSDAAWGPGGRELAISRRQDGKTVVEYPIGSPIFESADSIGDLRVSRSGDAVAFIERPFPGDDQGFVVSVSRRGERHVLTKTWIGTEGLAWSADDREVWFSATDTSDDARAIYAVTRDGKLRLVLRSPGALALYDVAADGRAILGLEDRDIRAIARTADGALRKLSWRPLMIPKAVSRDGRRAVIDDFSTRPYRTFLVPLDGSASMLVGEGAATDLSPDGSLVAAIPEDDTRLDLLPVGMGQPRALSAPGLHYKDARWSADGRSLFVTSRSENGAQQFWRQDAASGSIRVLNVPAREGQFLQVQGRDYLLLGRPGPTPRQMYDVATGALTTVAGLMPRDVVVAGSPTEPALLAVDDHTSLVRWTVVKIDLTRGTRTALQEIAPSESGRLLYARRWSYPIDDGRGLLFTEQHQENTLYVASGLK